MIDFAKILHVPDRLITHRDAWQFGNHEDGYLIGIDNLIRVSSLSVQFSYSFKGRLDRFWDDQKVKFNWKADVH